MPDPEREVAELYAAHATGLARYAASLARSSEMANDAVQETFLRYFAERRHGREIAHPRAWLYQVLHNYVVAVLAASAPQCTAPAGNLDQFPGGEQDPETQLARREKARHIAASLTPRELDCVRLRGEGRSYEEIGTHLNIRSGTVGALLSRAYGKLRWPPGKKGAIGTATAAAVRLLVLERL